MATKLTLNNISSTANKDQLVQSIDDNFKKIEDAFDTTLTRDGKTPNQMDADLDLNSRRVINVADPVSGGDVVTKNYLDNYPSIIKVTFNWLGSWASNTSYSVNDSVEHNGSSYVCTSDHISDSSTEPGVGASFDAVWDLVAAKGDTGNPQKATDTDVQAGTDDTKYITPYLVKTYYQGKNSSLDYFTTASAGGSSVKIGSRIAGWSGFEFLNGQTLETNGSSFYFTNSGTPFFSFDSSGNLVDGSVPWSSLISVPSGIDNLSKYFEVTGLAIGLGNSGSILHNLGAVPKVVYPFFTVTSNNGGWVAGEEIPVFAVNSGQCPTVQPQFSGTTSTSYVNYSFGKNSLPIVHQVRAGTGDITIDSTWATFGFRLWA